MMTYMILEDVSTVRLITVVNSYLDTGWTPLGGVSALNTSMGLRLFQAMTREKPEYEVEAES